LNLPETFIAEKAWTHFALVLEQATAQKIQLYINGFPFDTWDNIGAALFQFTPGELKVGASDHGANFQGWIDEFKVFSAIPDYEVVCNHAHGSLVGLENSYRGEMQAWADSYSADNHQLITNRLRMNGKPEYAQYACYKDYTEDFAANLQSQPEGTASLRDAITFPEGPIYHDAPRPDSSRNQFCISCHTDNSQIEPLKTAALGYKSGLLARDDFRRQPMQPLRMISANIPANWLPGSPGYAIQTPAEGVVIDSWVQESSVYVMPEVNSFVVVDTNTNKDIVPIENGQAIKLASLPSNWHIRINTNGLTERVEATLNNVVSDILQAPFIVNVPLELGEHAIMAQASGQGKSGEKKVLWFTLN
jgi:hypothetical protein